MTTKAVQTFAWLTLAFVLFATVAPIGMRPHDVLPVNVDRALAFMGMATLFVIAYPRHWIWVAAAVIVGAGLIELLQELSPTRHARLDDAMVKIMGASIGIVTGWTLNQICDRVAVP